MGLSGLILKRKENADIHRLIRDITLAAEQADLQPRINTDLRNTRGGGVYTTGNIADSYEDIPEARQWLMYLYSDDDCTDRFDWIAEGEKLIRVMIIEDISDCERILLDFLYEYLKRNPEDYFYAEEEWYYTYEDIVRIKQREFDPTWCYKKPYTEF